MGVLILGSAEPNGKLLQNDAAVLSFKKTIDTLADDRTFYLYDDRPSTQELASAIRDAGGKTIFIDYVTVIWEDAFAYVVEYDTAGSISGTTKMSISSVIVVADELDAPTALDLAILAGYVTIVALGSDGSSQSMITTSEDIRLLLPEANLSRLRPDDELDSAVIASLINDLFEFSEVRQHLISQALTKSQVVQLIIGAPISINRKIELLDPLLRFDDPIHEMLDYANDYTLHRKADHHWSRINWWSFTNRAQQLKKIVSEGNGDHTFGDDDTDLLVRGVTPPNIPLPFRAGDLVVLDCEPFAPVCNAVILDDDGNDFSRAPILYKSREGVYALSRLNVGRRWGDEHSALSPIYRMRHSSEILPGEELLEDIRLLIENDPDNARSIWALVVRNSIDDEIGEGLLRELLQGLGE